MKIGILTQPLRYNYGGILQNFALQTILKQMGHEVVTLDSPMLPRYSAFGWLSRFLRRFMLKLIGQEVQVFSEFWLMRQNKQICVNTNMFIDKHIAKKTIDREKREDYDALIVGSDQVWRPSYNKNNLYDQFFQFAKDWKGVKRLAYAASFGVDYWEYSEKQTEICKSLVGLFDGISVRESSGITLCKEYFGVEAKCVLDPTFLLDMKDYVEICGIGNYPQSKGNMLCYILVENETTKSIKNEIANELGLEYFDTNVFSLSGAQVKEQKPIEEWLRGFYDAEFVLADSFHACAFSIIFNKPFAVLSNAQRGNARFDHILSLFNQEFRLVKDFCDFLNKKDMLLKLPDAQNQIQILRKESLNFLSKHLS